MHRTGRPRPRITIAVLAALFALSGSAKADDDSPTDEPLKKITGEILMGDEDSAEQRDRQNWFRANIHSKKRHGFEFSRSFQLSRERRLIFSIQGPLVKKKTPGLAFEIQF